MDIGKDIALPYTSRLGKETAIFATLLSFRAKRSGVEKSRSESVEVIQRDVSTSLDMTEL